jgi:hypothetical protein
MPTSIRNGDVLFSDGTTQTTARTASNTVTSVNGQVGAVTVSSSVNTGVDEIGTYIMAYHARTNPNSGSRHSYVGVGSTVAGSSLRYPSAGDATNVTTAPTRLDNTLRNEGGVAATNRIETGTSPFPTANTTALSGTWRKMAGRYDSSSFASCTTQFFWYVSLWVRVS